MEWWPIANQVARWVLLVLLLLPRAMFSASEFREHPQMRGFRVLFDGLLLFFFIAALSEMEGSAGDMIPGWDFRSWYLRHIALFYLIPIGGALYGLVLMRRVGDGDDSN